MGGKILFLERDPAIWGLGVAAICGFADIDPWSIVPLTLMLTVLSVVYGSKMIWRVMKLWLYMRKTETVAASLVSSFYLVVAAYVAGDLAHHIAERLL